MHNKIQCRYITYIDFTFIHVHLIPVNYRLLWIKDIFSLPKSSLNMAFQTHIFFSYSFMGLGVISEYVLTKTLCSLMLRVNQTFLIPSFTYRCLYQFRDISIGLPYKFYYFFMRCQIEKKLSLLQHQLFKVLNTVKACYVFYIWRQMLLIINAGVQMNIKPSRAIATH